MRVFVFGTGRCGTVTFSKACSYIKNYTSGHETKLGSLGLVDREYPDNHIEVDPRNTWYLYDLREKYPDSFWVWLYRDRKEVERSIAARRGPGLMGHKTGVLVRDCTDEEAARDHVSVMIGICKLFTESADNTITIPLSRAKEIFPNFWSKIKADGKIARALKEFDTPHNAFIARRRILGER